MNFAARWTKRDSSWLVLAILAHALLLLVPLNRPDREAVARTAIKIDLVPYLSTEPQFPERKIEDTDDRAVTPEPRTDQPLPETSGPVQIIEPNAPVPENRLTTAWLLAMARVTHRDDPPRSAPRQLGVFVPQDLPNNWRKGAGAAALQSGDNLFDGMTVPARVEIVDRWLAADGSQNVVVNLPNGQSFCGRRAAWNPLQPLVEHLMMFRTCGSGGKRTFDISNRGSAASAKAAWAEHFE